jgi:Uma2 family endonuclease
MVFTPTKPLALDDFLFLPETKPASEYIEGNIVQKPMPQGKHSILQTRLVMIINAILMEQCIATAFTELRCTFGGRSIVPDVSIIKQENIPEDENGEIANTFDFAPEWMIEVLSPEQSSTKVVKKILHCLQHGAEVGWLIDPAEKSIFIYHSQKQIEVVDDFDQELIVPDFAKTVKLTARDIFDWLKKMN